MSAEPTASTSEQSLSALVELLRTAGFPIGVSEAIDATALVLALSDEAPGLTSRDRLRTRLRPIFCKSREQQDAFDDIFDRWLSATRTPPSLLRQAAPDTDTQRVTTTAAAPPSGTRWRRWLLIAACGAAIVGIVAGYQRWQRTVTPSTPVVVQTPSSPPSTTPAPAPAGPAAQTPVATVDRFVPATRFNVELLSAWVWLLGALPLAALLSISLPVLVLSRTRVRRHSEPMFLDVAPLAGEARRLVPRLSLEITERLARHVRSRGIDINRLARRPIVDVRRTIEATIRNRGIPTVQFSVSRIHPSYLLLVDVANERDPRGRLFFQWAERLQREGLAVELFLLRRTTADTNDGPIEIAPAPFGGRGAPVWAGLKTLREARFAERLIVVSDGDPFVDAGGLWRDDASRARFSRWRDRVLFTPIELRDWGAREESLERRERTADPGFIVLPLEESALGAWIDLVQTGRLTTVTLSDPQRYPALLRRGGGQRFVGDAPPDAATLERLMQQLQLYLGEQGFYWLAAMAVTPVVRWELTLLVGKAALGALPALANERLLGEALARNYRRLVRLPWLRQETMPDWLRLRLLLELSQTRQRELRVVIERLLARLSPRAVTDGIELGFERPPGAAVDPRSAWRERPQGAGGDALYLGYMSGLSPEQLVLRAPKEWRAWRGRIEPRAAKGWRGWLPRWRERTRAFWGKWAWSGGLPHLGFNRWRAALAMLLWLPLLGVLTALASSAPSAPVSPVSWFFVDRAHPLVMPVQAPRTVAFTLDGRHLVTIGADGVQRTWNAKTGALIDPAPTELVLGEDDISRDTVGKERARLHPTLVALPYTEVVSYAVSSKARWVVTGAPDGTLRLWDNYNGQPSGPAWDAHEGPVRALAFSADGRRLASVGDDNTLRLWDADPVAPLQAASAANGATRTVTLSLPAKAGAVAFEPDSTAVVVATDDGALRRWGVTTGQTTTLSDTTDKPLVALLVAENMRLLLAADGTLTQNYPDRPTAITIPTAFPPFAAAAFSSTMDLATGAEDGAARWFANSKSGDAVKPVAAAAAPITAMAASMLAFISGDATGELSVFESRTGVQIAGPKRTGTGHEAVTALAVSRDASILAAGTGHTLRILNAYDLEPRGSAIELPATIDALAFDWSGQYLAIAMAERVPSASQAKAPEPQSALSNDIYAMARAIEQLPSGGGAQQQAPVRQAPIVQPPPTAAAPDAIRNARVEIWRLAPTSASQSRRLVTETNQAATAYVQSLTGWRPLWWAFGFTFALYVVGVLVNQRRVTRVLARRESPS